MKKILVCLLFSLIFSIPVFSQTVYTIKELKEAMNDNNPDLHKLEQECIQARLDYKDALSGLGPTVDLQLSGTYMVNPPVDAIYLNVDELMNSIQWPTGVKPTSSNQYVKIYDGMENTLYNFQLSLTQPVFTWGKIENSIKLYKLIANIKEAQFYSFQQQAGNEIEIRLITLYYLKNILNILEEEKQFAQRLVETSENAEKSGMLLHQDVVDAKIQAKELEIAQQDVSEQIHNQLLELSRKTGIENLELESINYKIDEDRINDIMNWNRSEVEEKATSGKQLSIKMLTQLQDVNKLAEKIAKGSLNWKPDIALQATAGYAGSRFPFVEKNWRRKDDYSANISIGIKTTVWDGGKKLRDVSRKASNTEVSDINKMDARTTIRQTLSTQWNTADVCTMKIEYQDLKIESANSKIEHQQLLYNSGYGSETDLLSAKIEKCNQQIEKEKQNLSRAVACLTIEYLNLY